jgi:tetratricopeptide (TPR) repeat protein
MGLAYLKKGDPHRAIEFSEKGLSIAKEIADRVGEGEMLTTLGNAYLNLGDWPRAIESLESALTIERDIGRPHEVGTIISYLALACYHSGDFQRSMEYYDQCILMARGLGNTFGEAAALFNKSAALEELGNRAEAIRSAKAALQLFEQVEASDAVEARAWLAELQALSESEGVNCQN